MSFELGWLAYPALGVVAGFLAGLLGIGGGTVMVPILAMIFTEQGFAAGQVVHLSLGTSMAIIIFTALASLRAHHQHGAVLWPVVRDITPGILAGTALGSVFAAGASTRTLALIFTVFVVLIALQMLINIKPPPGRALPGRLGVAGVGIGIGVVSALVAIGGGALTVPFLTWCNVRMQTAIGTSAAVGLPIALGGSIGYAVTGWATPGLPPYSLGFVYLPAVLGVISASLCTAPLGARCAHRLPVPVLKRAFAGVLILLSLKMLLTVFA
jgi:uncharacterized membrane protein YfcA